MFVRRFNWLQGSLAALTVVLVSGAVCWPMLSHRLHRSDGADVRSVSPNSAQPAQTVSPPTPPGAIQTVAVNRELQEPDKGIKSFLSRWKMNDFLFLIAIENLTPEADASSERLPWFAVTPQHWRKNLTEQISRTLPVSREQAPFILARIVTASLFLGLATWFCWYGVRTNEPSRFMEAVFLTLAWFWLLLPTQNPWYWIWTLPFVPFARNRAWLAVSGLTMLYYLRFWLEYHWPHSPLPFTTYSGELQISRQK